MPARALRRHYQVPSVELLEPLQALKTTNARKGITNPPFPPSSGGAGEGHGHARQGITAPFPPEFGGSRRGARPCPPRHYGPLSPHMRGEQVSSCGGSQWGTSLRRRVEPAGAGSHTWGAGGGQVPEFRGAGGACPPGHAANRYDTIGAQRRCAPTIFYCVGCPAAPAPATSRPPRAVARSTAGAPAPFPRSPRTARPSPADPPRRRWRCATAG